VTRGSSAPRAWQLICLPQLELTSLSVHRLNAISNEPAASLW
jgi:hypothetical protein